MVIIKVKENSKQAKAFLELVKTFNFVEIIDKSESKKGNYNPKFVSMVKRAQKSGKGKILNPDNVWESIL